jgi:hypothetical protein
LPFDVRGIVCRIQPHRGWPPIDPRMHGIGRVVWSWLGRRPCEHREEHQGCRGGSCAHERRRRSDLISGRSRGIAVLHPAAMPFRPERARQIKQRGKAESVVSSRESGGTTGLSRGASCRLPSASESAKATAETMRSTPPSAWAAACKGGRACSRKRVSSTDGLNDGARVVIQSPTAPAWARGKQLVLPRITAGRG